VLHCMDGAAPSTMCVTPVISPSSLEGDRSPAIVSAILAFAPSKSDYLGNSDVCPRMIARSEKCRARCGAFGRSDLIGPESTRLAVHSGSQTRKPGVSSHAPPPRNLSADPVLPAGVAVAWTMRCPGGSILSQSGNEVDT